MIAKDSAAQARINQDKINSLKAALNGVSGYFSLDEAWALQCEISNWAPRQLLRVVEIGSYKGRSTIAIFLALRDRGSGSCLSIDPHSPTGKDSYVREHGVEDTFSEYCNNIDAAGIASFAQPIRETSEEAAKSYCGEPIDVLFIDGSHDYDDVKLDVLLWARYLRTNSLLAFNDPYSKGVNKAISEFLFAESNINRVIAAFHVNNTLFLRLGASQKDLLQSIRVASYLFVERQNFKLFKLLLKGLFESVGVVYRKPVVRD